MYRIEVGDIVRIIGHDALHMSNHLPVRDYHYGEVMGFQEVPTNRIPLVRVQIVGSYVPMPHVVDPDLILTIYRPRCDTCSYEYHQSHAFAS